MCNYTFTTNLIPWDSLEENSQTCLPVEMKRHLMTIVRRLKNLTGNEMDLPKEWIESSLILLEACLDRTWETLNSGYWQSVPIEYRYCYSLCSILKVVLLEFQSSIDTKDLAKNASLSKNTVQQIDKGILLGAPLPNMLRLLPRIASKLNNDCAVETLASNDLSINSISFPDSALPGFSEVAHYTEPSMELFYKKIFMPKVPALLKDCINHWEALRRWQDLKYLNKVAGNRTVPIEIGSRYTDEDWTQQLLSFSEFLQKHVLAKDNRVGYLAQHQLFDQVPELKDDFTIPEYCNFTDNDEVEPPDINAWFGPGGTVSPLHFDPKNNLLCQVFGYKKVILYSPEDSPNLYPYDTRLLNNTAQVDPLNPDYKKWPNFINAKGFMAYLKPSDILYIPPKWWHHVSALTPSFSISFWWS